VPDVPAATARWAGRLSCTLLTVSVYSCCQLRNWSACHHAFATGQAEALEIVRPPSRVIGGMVPKG